MNMQRRHGCFQITVAILIAIGLTQVVRAGDIRIAQSVEVDSPTVRLGDIAELSHFELDLESRMLDVVIADTPRVGATREIRATEVRGILRRAGANLANIRIYGSSRCVVSRKRNVPDPAESGARKIKHKPAKPLRRHSDIHPVAPASNTLEATVRDYIEARVVRDDGRLEIMLNRTSRAVRDALDSTVAPGTYRIRERDPLGLGLCALDVELIRDGHVVETIGLIGQIDLIKPVLVARKAINRGSTVDRRDLKFEDRRFSRAQDVGLSDMELAAGYEATRFIHPGEMLSLRSLKEKPVIERGDMVKILVRGDGVQITTTGKAQSSGALGDVIPVARNGSRRKRDVIDAMVTGPGVVTYGGVRQVARR